MSEQQPAQAQADTVDGSSPRSDKRLVETLRVMPVPIEALLDLSSKVSNKECTRLASKLHLDDMTVTKLLRAKYAVDALAQEILLDWRSRTYGTKEGTQLALEQALLGIGRRDLQEFFRKKCEELMFESAV